MHVPWWFAVSNTNGPGGHRPLTDGSVPCRHVFDSNMNRAFPDSVRNQLASTCNQTCFERPHCSVLCHVPSSALITGTYVAGAQYRQGPKFGACPLSQPSEVNVSSSHFKHLSLVGACFQPVTQDTADIRAQASFRPAIVLSNAVRPIPGLEA